MFLIKNSLIFLLCLLVSSIVFGETISAISNSPLLPGTKIIAGDPNQNEFFIVAENDVPKVKKIIQSHDGKSIEKLKQSKNMQATNEELIKKVNSQLKIALNSQSGKVAIRKINISSIPIKSAANNSKKPIKRKTISHIKKAVYRVPASAMDKKAVHRLRMAIQKTIHRKTLKKNTKPVKTALKKFDIPNLPMTRPKKRTTAGHKLSVVESTLKKTRSRRTHTIERYILADN